MEKIVIRPYNVVEKRELPEIMVDEIPSDGDPLEIEMEMYYVCESAFPRQDGHSRIGVIPLVVRNPSRVLNIKEYIDCLAIAHRRVLFRNSKGICDLENCDEMIIT